MPTGNVIPIKAKSPHKQVKITQQVIKKITKREKPYFIRDRELKGFAIQVNPVKEPVYRVEARLMGTGNNVNATIGSVHAYSLKEAKKIAAEYLKQIRKGNDPKIEKQKQSLASENFSKLLDTFLDDRGHRQKDSTQEDYRYTLHKYCKKFMQRQVKDITPTEIKEWYKAGSKTPTTTDKAYRYMKAVFQHGVGLEVIDKNPCDMITSLKMRFQAKKRDRYLKPNELGVLLEDLSHISHPEYKQENIRLSETVGDYITILLFTGLRKTEALSIRWVDVEMNNHVFTVRDTKNRKDHAVPMSSVVVRAFERRQEARKNDSEWVFPAKTGNGHAVDYKKQLIKISDKFGFKFSWHDLRRTFATAASEYGFDISTIKDALNHKKQDVTEHYIQTTAAKMKTTFDSVAEQILFWAFDDIPPSKMTEEYKKELKDFYADWEPKQQKAIDEELNEEEGFTCS